MRSVVLSLGGKGGIVLCLFLLCQGLVYAQIPAKPVPAQYAWRLLDQAELAFDAGEYGSALALAEAARINRKNEVVWSSYVLSQALNPEAVKRLGDNMSLVMRKLEERQAEDALFVLEGVFARVPESSFNNSISAVLSVVSEAGGYPDAEFLIGKIYKLEGEYALAEHYLLGAWNNRKYFDIPDTQYAVLYELASLSALQNNWAKYEEYLLLVAAIDPAYGKDGAGSAYVSAMLKALTGGMPIDKFFMLYRHPLYTCIPAYTKLASYYMKSGRVDRALPAALLGSLASFTRMYEAVKDRDSEFVYTSFSSALEKMMLNPAIVEWSIANNVWEGFYICAQALYEHGERAAGVDLFNALSVYSPEEYWRDAALKQFIEKA